jgi:hypothetical protein|tara:strand:- start:73 stop:456 length:384 start_codon:yes stop_codon:yes gene_type:complete
MNPEDQKLLDELKIFCSPEIVAKYNHQQENQNDWTRFYYYKDRRRQVVTNANVDYDYEVSSTLNYNKRTFYKITAMSMKDGYFDYYFKLKSHLPYVVVKKSNRNHRGEELQPLPTTTENGKFVLRFN